MDDIITLLISGIIGLLLGATFFGTCSQYIRL